MSKDDFHRRLERLQTQSPQKHTILAQHAGQTVRSASKPSRLRVGVGGAVFGLGLYSVRYANQNYESLRDGGGLSAIATFGLGGVVLIILGIVLMIRAIFSRTAQAPAPALLAKQRASSTAIWITSLFGFFSGAVSCFYMFLWALVRYVGTEKALTYEHGSLGIAILLCLVALSFGFLSLFLRGRSLGRVFVYYWCGAVLTFAFFKLADVNMLRWQPLMDQLQ